MLPTVDTVVPPTDKTSDSTQLSPSKRDEISVSSAESSVVQTVTAKARRAKQQQQQQLQQRVRARATTAAAAAATDNTLPAQQQQQQQVPTRRDKHHEAANGSLSSDEPARLIPGLTVPLRSAPASHPHTSSATAAGASAAYASVVASPKKTASTSVSSTARCRGEEGWREVTNRSSTSSTRTKRVTVSSSAISRVIGRGGSNVNCIRDMSGAHIEIEKKCKGQVDRVITIKGCAESVKMANLMISDLVGSHDADASQLLNKYRPLHSIPAATTTGVTAAVPNSSQGQQSDESSASAVVSKISAPAAAVASTRPLSESGRVAEVSADQCASSPAVSTTASTALVSSSVSAGTDLSELAARALTVSEATEITAVSSSTSSQLPPSLMAASGRVTVSRSITATTVSSITSSGSCSSTATIPSSALSFTSSSTAAPSVVSAPPLMQARLEPPQGCGSAARSQISTPAPSTAETVPAQTYSPFSYDPIIKNVPAVSREKNFAAVVASGVTSLASTSPSSGAQSCYSTAVSGYSTDLDGSTTLVDAAKAPGYRGGPTAVGARSTVSLSPVSDGGDELLHVPGLLSHSPPAHQSVRHIGAVTAPAHRSAPGTPVAPIGTPRRQPSTTPPPPAPPISPQSVGGSVCSGAEPARPSSVPEWSLAPGGPPHRVTPSQQLSASTTNNLFDLSLLRSRLPPPLTQQQQQQQRVSTGLEPGFGAVGSSRPTRVSADLPALSQQQQQQHVMPASHLPPPQSQHLTSTPQSHFLSAEHLLGPPPPMSLHHHQQHQQQQQSMVSHPLTHPPPNMMKMVPQQVPRPIGMERSMKDRLPAFVAQPSDKTDNRMFWGGDFINSAPHTESASTMWMSNPPPQMHPPPPHMPPHHVVGAGVDPLMGPPSDEFLSGAGLSLCRGGVEFSSAGKPPHLHQQQHYSPFCTAPVGYSAMSRPDGVLGPLASSLNAAGDSWQALSNTGGSHRPSHDINNDRQANIWPTSDWTA